MVALPEDKVTLGPSLGSPTVFFLFAQPAAELDIVLHGEDPIPVEEIGSLLSAIGRDYRDTTGRSLVVAGFKQGSLVAQLGDIAAIIGPHIKDAAEVAKGVKAVADFSRAVASAFKRAEEGLAPDKRRRRKPGERFVEAMLDTAIKKGHEVEYRQISAAGASTEIRVTPRKAVVIREKAKLRAIELQRDEPRRLEARSSPRMLTYDSGQMADTLVHLSEPQGQPGEVQLAIQAMASAMHRSGLGHMLEAIAQELQARGRGELATLVRHARDE